MLGDAATGKVRTVHTERDSTWIDVVDDVVWLDKGKSFTWISDRDGWKHVYAVSRDGKTTRPVTKGAFDVIEVHGHRYRGRLAVLRRLTGESAPALPLPQPAQRQGSAGADHARARGRHPCLRHRAELPSRHRNLFQHRESADRPPGPAARQPVDPDPGGQPRAARAGQRAPRGARSSGSRSRRRTARRCRGC